MRNTLLWRGGVLLDGDVGSYASFLLAGTADGVHNSEVKVITVGCAFSLCALEPVIQTTTTNFHEEAKV